MADPLEPLWRLASDADRRVDTLSNPVLPSPSCKQGSSSRPRTSPERRRRRRHRKTGGRRAPRGFVRRLFGGRPDAQKVGAQGGASV